MRRRDLLAALPPLAFSAPFSLRAAAPAIPAASGDWRIAFRDRAADLPRADADLALGAAPAGLSGALYGVGPGRWRDSDRTADHWWSGRRLMRAWRFGSSGASLQASFADTSGGQSLATFGGKLLVLDDLQPPRSLDPRSLQDLGPTFRSCPPKSDTGKPCEPIDPSIDDPQSRVASRLRQEPGGQGWGVGQIRGSAFCWTLDADGQGSGTNWLDLPWNAYLHDLTATHDKLILVISPLIGQPDGQGRFSGFEWKPKEPTRILILDKADLNNRRILELDALFVHGLGDAWSEKDGTIIFDLTVTADPDWLIDGGRQVLSGNWTQGPAPKLARVVIPRHAPPRVERTDQPAGALIGDPRLAGWPRGFTAYPTADRQGPLFHALAVRDWKSGRSDVFDLGPGKAVEPPAFAARPDGQGELDGWLVTPVHDLRGGPDELQVFDARRVGDGPLCVWRAKAPLPMGLSNHLMSSGPAGP